MGRSKVSNPIIGCNSETYEEMRRRRDIEERQMLYRVSRKQNHKRRSDEDVIDKNDYGWIVRNLNPDWGKAPNLTHVERYVEWTQGIRREENKLRHK